MRYSPDLGCRLSPATFPRSVTLHTLPTLLKGPSVSWSLRFKLFLRGCSFSFPSLRSKLSANSHPSFLFYLFRHNDPPAAMSGTVSSLSLPLSVTLSLFPRRFLFHCTLSSFFFRDYFSHFVCDFLCIFGKTGSVLHLEAFHVVVFAFTPRETLDVAVAAARITPTTP